MNYPTMRHESVWVFFFKVWRLQVGLSHYLEDLVPFHHDERFQLF